MPETGAYHLMQIFNSVFRLFSFSFLFVKEIIVPLLQVIRVQILKLDFSNIAVLNIISVS